MRFPNQLQNRLAATIADTKKLVNNAHQRLNTVGSAVSALQPGDWEDVTLANGWGNVPGYIPAQVRVLQSGMSQLVGHIQGGTTANGTVIGTLTAGFYNPVHQHAFTVNVIAGAAAVSVPAAVAGTADDSGLPDGTIANTSSSAGLFNGGVNGSSGGGGNTVGHTHGAGSFAVINGQHSHAAGSFALNNGHHTHGTTGISAATPVSYNTAILNLDTSGNLTLVNCPAAGTQISFSENLPLVTA